MPLPLRPAIGLLVMCLVVPFAAAAEPLRVMTFNIRYNNAADGENAWPKRRDWVAQIVIDEKVDILGAQEVQRGQLQDLEARLKDYAWFGAGRDDGKEKGEHVPLFWKKERFEALDKGHFWLSTKPDVPGSMGWDTSITRMVTWVKLKDKASDKSLFVANTHFDHRGVEARRESAKLILEKFPKLAGDLPVVLTGDFNSLPTSDAYKTLTGKEAVTTWLLTDTRRASKTEPKGPESTWNGFTKIFPEQQIDFIFARGLTSESHAILETVKDGKFASDHLPAVAELSWK